jgi:hypothetical protein
MVLGIEFWRFLIIAPPRERRRDTVPAGAPPPILPDPIWSVQIKSNGSDLVIPIRLVFLLKSPWKF